MNIFMDICQEIDIYNHEISEGSKGIKSKYYHSMRKKKLLSLIESFGKVAVYDNYTINFFINTYLSTIDNIPLPNFGVEKSDINRMVTAIYTRDSSVLKIIIRNSDPALLNLIFYDKESQDYRRTRDFNVPNYLHYNGTDINRIKIINYADSVYRLLMVDYLTKRLNITERKR